MRESFFLPWNQSKSDQFNQSVKIKDDKPKDDKLKNDKPNDDKPNDDKLKPV